MKTKYTLSTGKVIIVEVTEEVANYIADCIAEDKRIHWREEKRKNLSFEYLEEINSQIADNAPTPLQVLEQKECHNFYTWDLPLPDKLKIVLILHYQYELTVREIASKLQIPKSTAHHRLKKALEILKVGQKGFSNSVYSVGLNAKQNKTED